MGKSVSIFYKHQVGPLYLFDFVIGFCWRDCCYVLVAKLKSEGWVKKLLLFTMLLVGSFQANAVVIDFSGTGGQLGTSEIFTADSVSVTVNGFAVDFLTTAGYALANLFQRDDSGTNRG